MKQENHHQIASEETQNSSLTTENLFGGKDVLRAKLFRKGFLEG